MFPMSGRHVALAVAALLAIGWVPALGLTVAQPWRVEGESMEPAIENGSVLLVDSLLPHLAGYERGDIVVLALPPGTTYPHPILVKRIIAVAGDHVVIDHGVVRVNGSTPDEPYLAPGTMEPTGARRVDVVVPDGSVFVMGDHRENSFDSTSFGPVATGELVGRAWMAIGPGGAMELPGAAAGGS